MFIITLYPKPTVGVYLNLYPFRAKIWKPQFWKIITVDTNPTILRSICLRVAGIMALEIWPQKRKWNRESEISFGKFPNAEIFRQKARRHLPSWRKTSSPWAVTLGLQGRRHPCLSFVGWHRSCVLSWRMYAGYRRLPPSSVVCWQSHVLGQEITQPVRWPPFCHRRANAVEQSAWTASATRHHLRTIQTIVENVDVWLVGTRHPVSER